MINDKYTYIYIKHGGKMNQIKIPRFCRALHNIKIELIIKHFLDKYYYKAYIHTYSD